MNTLRWDLLLQRERPQAMYDKEVHGLIKKLFAENFADDPNLRKKFLETFDAWIMGSQLNQISGLDSFPDRDVIVGVTQYLDDLYQMFGPRIVVIENEYRYHWRLNPNITVRSLATLQTGDILILSMPFPQCGDIHPQTNLILQKCADLNIPVHIDSCWYGCTRDITFNYDHSAIQSVGFSLSKSLGLGVNRIGVRYARKRWNGPVSLINDFNMTIHVLMWMGIQFMTRLGPDFWQKKYGKHYVHVCSTLNLQPTKAIHIALEQKKDSSHSPVGVRRLLRKLGDFPCENL